VKAATLRNGIIHLLNAGFIKFMTEKDNKTLIQEKGGEMHVP